MLPRFGVFPDLLMFIPRVWGTSGVEEGCVQKSVTAWIPAPRLREDGLRGNDSSQRGSIVPNALLKGVQRGFAPLRFFLSPKIGGLGG